MGEAMIANKQIDKPVFAFHLQSDSSQPGELVFGGIDQSHYSGELVSVPLISETYWEVSMGSLKLGDTSVASSAKAIIDSGTSLLAGPQDAVSAIAKQLGATSVLNKEYTIDCSKVPSLPSINVSLGGKPFTLEGKDYTINSGKTCLVGLIAINVPPPRGPLWIMGDIFMRKYYCVFDYGGKQMQIGLAKAAAQEALV